MVHLVVQPKKSNFKWRPLNQCFYELKTNRVIYSIFELRRIISKFNYNNNSIFVSNINYANVITILALRKYSNLKIILTERTALKELDIYFSIKVHCEN